MSNDFSQGKVWRNIVAQAIPLTLAEFVHLLYNIVDRIYIGHMDVADNMALTGVGLTFPIVTLIAAFTALFGKIVIMVIPKTLFQIFTSDTAVIEKGTEALNLYFFGFFFMSFQFAGQTVFQALGRAKQAVFFSLLRKVVIVVPLTILLPIWGLGVNGVFLAEPISNAIGGLACFITMWITVYKKL